MGVYFGIGVLQDLLMTSRRGDEKPIQNVVCITEALK